MSHLAVVNGIDPKLTESFLVAQPGVAGANVWYARGRLRALVSVFDDDRVKTDRLIEACATVLGDSQAPADIELVRVRPRAA